MLPSEEMPWVVHRSCSSLTLLNTCLPPAVIHLHTHGCTRLAALGRSGHHICFARHALVHIISLLLAALCRTPVFDSISCSWWDWHSDRLIYFLAKCRTTITVHILCPAFSLHPSAFLSLNWVNIILLKLWSRHGAGSEAICPVITLVRQSVTHADTEIPFDYDDRNYNISKHNQLSFVQTDIQSTVIKYPKLCH